MLILPRKVGQSTVINGNVIVKVVRVDGDQIKLGVQAPAGEGGDEGKHPIAP
jgi:carbon storage regulator